MEGVSFKSILARKQDVFENKLDIDHGLLSTLQAREVITGRHSNAIKTFGTSEDKAGKLLEILLRRDDCFVPVFLHTLFADGQKELARILGYKDLHRSSHARVLRKLYSKLSKTIDAESVARNMFSCNALTLKELQSIQAIPLMEPIKAAELLLNIVIDKPSAVYGSFLTALESTDQQHLCELIVAGNERGFDDMFSHARIIRQHYEFLVDNLDVIYSGLVGSLYSARVLSAGERDIMYMGPPFTQNEKLLTVLMRKTKDQFDKFLDALDEAGQIHIRNHIIASQGSAGVRSQPSIQSHAPVQDDPAGEYDTRNVSPPVVPRNTDVDAATEPWNLKRKRKNNKRRRRSLETTRQSAMAAPTDTPNVNTSLESSIAGRQSDLERDRSTVESLESSGDVGRRGLSVSSQLSASEICRQAGRRHNRDESSRSSSDECSEDNSCVESVDRGAGGNSSGEKSQSMRSRRHKIRKDKEIWMRPERYDGRGCFETFLSAFENRATHGRWSREGRAAELRRSLTGSAADLMRDAGELTYDELVDKLRRSSRQKTEEKFQSELTSRRRKHGESVGELARDTQRLTYLAYPDDTSMHQSLDAFLTALGGTPLESQVREVYPADLEEALRLAELLDRPSNSQRMRKKAKRRASSEERKQQVAAVPSDTPIEATPGENVPPDSNGARRQHETQPDTCVAGSQPADRQRMEVASDDDVSVADLVAKVAKLESRASAGVAMPTGESNLLSNPTHWQPDVDSPAQDMICSRKHERKGFIPADEGRREEWSPRVDELQATDQGKFEPKHAHVSNRQPQLDTEETQTRPLQTGMSGSAKRHTGPGPPRPLCFTCGRPGHLARQCRQRAIRDQRTGHRLVYTRRKRFDVGGTAYLRAEVVNRICTCLLDTGSEVTLIPASFARNQDIGETDATIVAADGRKVSLPFKVGAYVGRVKGLVSKHVTEVTLGVDWLRENATAWNFSHSWIRIGDTSYHLHRRPTWWRATASGTGHRYTTPAILQSSSTDNDETATRSQNSE